MSKYTEKEKKDIENFAYTYYGGIVAGLAVLAVTNTSLNNTLLAKIALVIFIFLFGILGLGILPWIARKLLD